MSASPVFHELLKKYRYESGFTQVDLAKALDNHQPVISNFERGRSTPTRDEILAITKVLKLNESQTNGLLISAKYPPIQETITSGGGTAVEAAMKLLNYNIYGQTPANSSYQELNIQIQDLKDSISSLSENFTKSNAANSTKNPPQSETLLAQVQDLQTSISELQATSKEITAPVALPTKQQLEVRLIPTTSFERLEEYRAEENKWFTWSGVFFGAVIGIFVNLVTGGEATISTWIVAITFLVMVIVTGLSARNYSQRAKNLRDEIIEKKAPSNQGTTAKTAG